ncbi:hypothetical protein BST61_g3397 [Cercospora zeina]
MANIKNGRRRAKKRGKVARGLAILPIASSSRASNAASSNPKPSATSNALPAPTIDFSNRAKEEGPEQNNNESPLDSTSNDPEPISQQVKDLLNKIQLTIYDTSADLDAFFTNIKDEQHLHEAIRLIQYLHHLEVQEQLNRHCSLLPENPLFSTPPRPKDVPSAQTYLLALATSIRELQQKNEVDAKNAASAATEAEEEEEEEDDDENENEANEKKEPTTETKPRKSHSTNKGELTTWICDVCDKYISMVRFTCIKERCHVCEEGEASGREKMDWCSRECWEEWMGLEEERGKNKKNQKNKGKEVAWRGGGGGDEKCEVRAVLIEHVGPEVEDTRGEGKRQDEG